MITLHEDMQDVDEAFSELIHQIKFNLCFAIPVRFSSVYLERRELGSGSVGFYRMRSTWWQWRDRVWGQKVEPL